MKSKISILVAKPKSDEIRILPHWNTFTAARLRMASSIAINPCGRGGAMQRPVAINKNKGCSTTVLRQAAFNKGSKLEGPDVPARAQAQVRAEETLLSDQGRL
jgi:hypothetical protein